MKFSSAQEFRSHITALKSLPYTAFVKNDEEPRVSITRAGVLGMEEYQRLINATSEQTGYEVIQDRISKKFRYCLTSTEEESFDKLFEIGIVSTPTIDASIARSREGYYTILLNASLVFLIHVINTYRAATICPEDVAHCSDKNASDLRPEDLEFYTACAIASFLDGAMSTSRVVLRPWSTASALSGFFTDITELFLVAHEFAHFLHGDLIEPTSNACGHESLPLCQKEHDRQREFLADQKAFEIVKRGETRRTQDMSFLGFSEPIAFFFELLESMKVTGTESHPAPDERLKALRKTFSVPIIEQDGADQPATAPEPKPEVDSIPQSESEGRCQ